MGPSGSGKSTLAAAFHDEGYKIVADDVCVVGIEPEGQAVAHGGIPRLRLWEDALAASGRTSADYQLSYAGDEQFRKFDVPTGKDMAAPVPLSAIFELVPGEPMSCERLAGLEAVEAVFANTYRGGFVLSAGDPTQHWQACLKLVSSVPVYRLRRPVNPESTARIIAQLTESIPVPPC